MAFLKARLDEGSDHLGIFMPLVMDALSQLPTHSFATTDVQEALATRHGIAMPLDAVATLLKRATRKHHLLREAGRYRRNPGHEPPRINVAGEKAGIEQGQQRLAAVLQTHAAKRGLTLESTEAALDALFRFLEDEEVGILLGVPAESTTGGPTERQRGIVAEFLHDVASKDPALASVVRGMTEGMVLYHAAFLPDLGGAERSFRDLRVIFDSVLVRQALGYEGDGQRLLMRETIDLLKASGVECLVFDKTVHEIQRILAMYEERLATTAGRSALRPVPMARHFLTQHYSPGDVREMSALLEKDIVAAGLQIQRAPRRIQQHTKGEKALATRLADPTTKDEMEPRVTHDVDCVAGVLTLRGGHRSTSLERVRAVFATSSPLVIKNTRLWWEEDEGETGIPPIVHIRALANLAWLKKPSISTDFQMRELIALCAAAMRPTQETWRRFLKHLERLRASQRLSSDEATAIVISAMSDRLLREAELEEDDLGDVDATTMDEVAERVRQSYGAQAEERVRSVSSEYEQRLATAEARADSATARADELEQGVAERLRKRELRIEGRARLVARWATRSLHVLVVGLVVGGGIALILGHPFHGGWLGIVVGSALVVFIVLETFGILRHVSNLQKALEVKLTRRLRRWLECDSESDETGETEPGRLLKQE